MSLNQTGEGLSRREVLGLGVAGLLTGLGPKPVGAREDDKRATKIYFHATRNIARNEPGRSGIFTVDPETDSWQFVIASMSARVSHDGKALIYVDDRERSVRKLTLRLLDVETGETKFLSALYGSACWSSDDRQLIVSGRKTIEDGPTETWRVEAADPSKMTRLPIAEADTVVDWSPDDKTLLVLKGKNEKGEKVADSFRSPVHLFDLAGKDLGRVLAPSPTRRFREYRFTRDGKRIGYTCFDTVKNELEPRIVAIDGKDDRPLLKPREGLVPSGPVLWSPDDKLMAVSYHELAKGAVFKPPYEFIGFRIEIVDANGSNRRRLALPEDFELMRVVDWR